MFCFLCFFGEGGGGGCIFVGTGPLGEAAGSSLCMINIRTGLLLRVLLFVLLVCWGASGVAISMIEFDPHVGATSNPTCNYP